MHESLIDTWKHMRALGLCALAHANRHAGYCDMDNGAWPAFSVIQAAHAAEILIKARIAQEHPLLIFESLPKATDEHIDLVTLFEKGKTIEWNELPNRLWAVSGIRIHNIEMFKKFGKLRNGIQHFAQIQNIDFCTETLRFIFTVIDPFINECWNLFAIDYDEDYEPYVYFIPALVTRKISFLVSKEAATCFPDCDIDWTKTNTQYKTRILQRVKQAHQNMDS